MHNGQSEGTVGRRGPSFLQRLTAAWAEYELNDAERERVSLCVSVSLRLCVSVSVSVSPFASKRYIIIQPGHVFVCE